MPRSVQFTMTEALCLTSSYVNVACNLDINALGDYNTFCAEENFHTPLTFCGNIQNIEMTILVT